MGMSSTGQKIGAGAGLLLTGLSMGGCDLFTDEHEQPVCDVQFEQAIRNVAEYCLRNHQHGVRVQQNFPHLSSLEQSNQTAWAHTSCITGELAQRRFNAQRGFDFTLAIDKTLGSTRVSQGAITDLSIWRTEEERPEDSSPWIGTTSMWHFLDEERSRARFLKTITQQLLRPRHFIGTDEHGMAKLFCCRDKHEGAKQYTGDGPSIRD